MAPPRTRARWRFFGRARCDGRALGLLLMARAATMRAENRRRWSGRGGGGAALAAVAAAWLSARRRAALGGSCLDDGAPRWGVTARRWFGVKGLPPPPRATGRLIRTHLGKESAASPHFAALLPCAALHTCPPQLLLISPVLVAFGRRTAAYCGLRDSGGDLDGLGDRDGSSGVQNGAGCVTQRVGSASRRLSPPA